MTDLTDPLDAPVLIMGRNLARGYDAATLDHAHHLDALFNRNGQSYCGLYNEVIGQPSPTRRNIDRYARAPSIHANTSTSRDSRQSVTSASLP